MVTRVGRAGATREAKYGRGHKSLVSQTGNPDHPAVNQNRFTVTNKTTNPVSRRTALGLGAAVAASVLLAPNLFAARARQKVVVWSEGSAAVDPKSSALYPHDINAAVADGLKPLAAAGWEIIIASLSEPDQGVSDERLKSTDVLIWWGHKKHKDVKDELVERIVRRVKEDGMGFIALHSSHFSKPFKALMDTPCSWREYKADGTSARVIVKDPSHPIAKGVKDFQLPLIERYGEPFAVPTPEAVPLDGLYTKPDGTTQPGRMGLCWTVGKGKVFYFTPGHETYNDFLRDEVRLILRNAVQWAAPKQ